MSKLIILFFILCVAMSAMANSCQSCGEECAPACGSRYFRTCCFNYLRRKRGSQFKIYTHSRYEIPRAFEDTWSQEPVEMYDSYM